MFSGLRKKTLLQPETKWTQFKNYIALMHPDLISYIEHNCKLLNFELCEPEHNNYGPHSHCRIETSVIDPQILDKLKALYKDKNAWIHFSANGERVGLHFIFGTSHLSEEQANSVHALVDKEQFIKTFGFDPEEEIAK